MLTGMLLIIQTPIPNAAMYTTYAKSWNKPWTSQTPRNDPSRMRIDPTGKNKTNARAARTPWAMMILCRDSNEKPPRPLVWWKSWWECRVSRKRHWIHVVVLQLDRRNIGYLIYSYLRPVDRWSYNITQNTSRKAPNRWSVSENDTNDVV